MEGAVGVEPALSRVWGECSPAELRAHPGRAWKNRVMAVRGLQPDDVIYGRCHLINEINDSHHVIGMDGPERSVRWINIRLVGKRVIEPPESQSH
jgi:hypothetical protein